MSSLYPDAFDWETRPVLSVAGRFRDYGVDYAPAIHNLRSAMDEPRWDQGQFKRKSAVVIDDWLAQDAKRRK